MAYDMIAVMRQAQRRRKEGLRLRAAGKTLQEIADLWGITRQRVHDILKRAQKVNGS